MLAVIADLEGKLAAEVAARADVSNQLSQQQASHVAEKEEWVKVVDRIQASSDAQVSQVFGGNNVSLTVHHSD